MSNLFGEYFNNPTKSYIYTNLQCNGPSADELSFDINASNGQISNNDEVLAKVDLSDVHVPLTQYTNDMKIIEPYSYAYIKGMAFGETYTTKVYGKIVEAVMTTPEWMYNSILFLVLKYTDTRNGKPVVVSLKCAGNLDEDKTFIDTLNEYMTEHEIPIEAEYADGDITFTATELGYDFWIDHVMLWTIEHNDNLIGQINEWMIENGKVYDYGWDDEEIDLNGIPTDNVYLSRNVYSSVIRKSDYSRLYNMLNSLSTDFDEILKEENVKKIYLYENYLKRISPRKYRNGAMKGLLVKATYPKYQADTIYENQRSLKFAHLRDAVEEWYMLPSSLVEGTCVATRKIIDVVDTFGSQYDSEAYDKYLGKYSHFNTYDNWIDADEIPVIFPGSSSKWTASHIPYTKQLSSVYKDIESRDAMGLEGYCAYCTKNNLWMNMGQMYCLTSVSDDTEDPYSKNLIPSFVIYNPNPFPVQINYITFA